MKKSKYTKKSRHSKKHKYTKIAVAVVIALIVIIAATVYVVTLPPSPIKTYHVNDKVDDTGYVFAGIDYAGNNTLYANFKGFNTNASPALPEITSELVPNGNSTVLIGYQAYMIVSYSYAHQTVSMKSINVIPT
jgi:hypothetical protein